MHPFIWAFERQHEAIIAWVIVRAPQSAREHANASTVIIQTNAYIRLFEVLGGGMMHY